MIIDNLTIVGILTAIASAAFFIASIHMEGINDNEADSSEKSIDASKQC